MEKQYDFRIEYIRTLIERKGFRSMRRFAEIAGMPPTTIHGIFNRNDLDNMKVSTLIALCQELEISPEFILLSPSELKSLLINTEENRLITLKEKEAELSKRESLLDERQKTMLFRELELNQREKLVLEKEMEKLENNILKNSISY